MLTAAVCGDVFASPSVDAVLAGILAVTGTAGCLLIVKNYTGDRLNFGLAAERARAFGLKVSHGHRRRRRGAARPAAGARRRRHAVRPQDRRRAGRSRAPTSTPSTAAAQRVIAGAISIGMSLDTCTVPGSPKEDRIAAGKAELGLGIHGEAGIEQVDFTGARAAMAMVVDRLAPP